MKAVLLILVFLFLVSFQVSIVVGCLVITSAANSRRVELLHLELQSINGDNTIMLSRFNFTLTPSIAMIATPQEKL